MQKTSQTAMISLVIFVLSSLSSFPNAQSHLLQYAQALDPIAPTPMGDSHIGRKGPSDRVQLRFTLPTRPAAAYWLNLAGIVAFTGKGSSYQLVLTKHSPDGQVIYEGPTIADGNGWNTSNAEPIEITDELTKADYERGYIDVFAGAYVEGDGWTVYRFGSGRGVSALATVLTPQLRDRLQTQQALETRGISIIPAPKQLHLTDGEPFRLTDGTRIVYADDAAGSVRSAAAHLRDFITEKTGMRLEVSAAGGEDAADRILLTVRDRNDAAISPDFQPPEGDESYALRVSAGDIVIVGGAPAGCFYGAMTAAQLLTNSAGTFTAPACIIRDWPSFPYRIIQYDIARGQTVNLEYVKRLIRQFARCKINAILFYMEDDFKFDKYPFLGREGTFTYEKARELSQYAHEYHVQLMPQFESLGHAAAVLRHDQMEDLREAGDPWVFCTSEPRTWRFLDDVYAELVEAFPYTEFIHVGGDEFEPSFGKCDRCRAKTAQDGIGALYAEHINRLHDLVEKHGKTMMLWPAHHGPTDATTRMTMQYHEMLPKEIVLTEWIYHGPQRYPQIEKYQELGFADVHCCPSVRATSSLWPDNKTAFRAIAGFYRAGEQRDCGGAYCTTWGFMHGALFENSMYQLIFAAECSWTPRTASRQQFNRRFADVWLGIEGPEAAQQIEGALFDPLSLAGDDRVWRHWRRQVTELLWTEPRNVMRDWALRRPEFADASGELLQTTDELLQRVERLSEQAGRNRLTLRAARVAFSMGRLAARKLDVFQRQAESYKQAMAQIREKPQACVETLTAMAEQFRGLAQQTNEAAAEYDYFVDNCGAYKRDPQRLREQASQLTTMAEQIQTQAMRVRSEQVQELPAPRKFGFLYGSCERAGAWAPHQMSEEGTVLRYDVTDLIHGPGELVVEWEYTRGAHGLEITSTELICDGEVVSRDEHKGWAGAGSHNNAYHLQLDEYHPDAKCELVGEVTSRGGTDSNGIVWVFTPDRADGEPTAR